MKLDLGSSVVIVNLGYSDITDTEFRIHRSSECRFDHIVTHIEYLVFS